MPEISGNPRIGDAPQQCPLSGTIRGYMLTESFTARDPKPTMGVDRSPATGGKPTSSAIVSNGLYVDRRGVIVNSQVAMCLADGCMPRP
jgi:hypothetical protein